MVSLTYASYTFSNIVTRIQKVYRQLDYIVVRQVKQKRVGCGGTGCTDAVLSKQNGELRNANWLELYRLCFPTRNTI